MRSRYMTIIAAILTLSNLTFACSLDKDPVAKLSTAPNDSHPILAAYLHGEEVTAAAQAACPDLPCDLTIEAASFGLSELAPAPHTFDAAAPFELYLSCFNQGPTSYHPKVGKIGQAITVACPAEAPVACDGSCTGRWQLEGMITVSNKTYTPGFSFEQAFQERLRHLAINQGGDRTVLAAGRMSPTFLEHDLVEGATIFHQYRLIDRLMVNQHSRLTNDFELAGSGMRRFRTFAGSHSTITLADYLSYTIMRNIKNGSDHPAAVNRTEDDPISNGRPYFCPDPEALSRPLYLGRFNMTPPHGAGIIIERCVHNAVPRGSYTSTCEKIDYDEQTDTLSADCRDSKRKSISSTLVLAACQEVGNSEGVLICIEP